MKSAELRWHGGKRVSTNSCTNPIQLHMGTCQQMNIGMVNSMNHKTVKCAVCGHEQVVNIPYDWRMPTRKTSSLPDVWICDVHRRDFYEMSHR